MINKNNILTKKSAISYFQILTLVISLFAFSYIIFSSTVSPVDAQIGTQYGCCEKTNSGEFCQDVPQSQCSGKFSPTSCQDTSFSSCNIGCCVSSQTGICAKQATKGLCELQGGKFSDSKECAVNECKKGCCGLGNENKWLSRQNCEFEAKSLGYPFEFDETVKSEAACVLLVEGNKTGACVFQSGDKKTCKYTTLNDCITRTGSENNFYNGFCSGLDSSLNVSCTAKNYTGCLDGKEDVYWFDSCDNQEDIALDCNLFDGNYCGKDNNKKYICKDINCVVDGVTRKNGESWCEYDGSIGIGNNGTYGKDPVGSRHLRHVCYFGEEKVEYCSDYRNEICVEQKFDIENGDISQAACRTNNWRSCLSYNNDGNSSESKCNKNPDCFYRKIDMTKGNGNFKFNLCLPKYPPGFDITIDENLAADTSGNAKNPSTEICSSISEECTEIWVKSCIFCSWKCKVNCDCHTQKFTNQMNDLCVSLGDCGAYTNYVGEVTTGGYNIPPAWKHPGKLSNARLDEYKKNADKNPNQLPANPGDFEFLKLISPEDLDTILENGTFLEKITGASGSPLLLKILSISGKDDERLREGIANPLFTPINYAGYTAADLGINIGKPDFKKKSIGAGQLIGGAIAAAGLLLGSIALAIVGLIIAFIFLSKTRENHVKFQCKPWTPPTGVTQADCDKCNQLNIPCTEYRCESLGETCEIENKGTPYQLCLDKGGNLSIPQIKPWTGLNRELPSSGYKYENIKTNGYEIVKSDDNGCIEPFTNIKYGIKIENTNGEKQNARCKIDVDATKSFDEMASDFDERFGGASLPYHMSTIFIPSPEAFKNQYNLTDEDIKKLGDTRFYVKCSSNGRESSAFEIKTCVNPGPDLTPPRIITANPASGSYIKYGQNELDLEVYVNEPSSCRMSKSDKAYGSMETELTCNTLIEDYTTYGLKCSTRLTNINDTSQYYIRCQDLSSNHNVMSESFVYSISKTQSPLEISKTKPQDGDVITGGSDPFSLDLKIETTGGAGNNTICEWEETNRGYRDSFPSGSNNAYTYRLTTALNGDYNINFMCEDAAGNKAEKNISFQLKLDTNGPGIARIFNDGGLKIITIEKSECRYSFTPNLLFENLTIMNSDDGREHFADWQLNTYYIQCEDEFGNRGGILKVRPFNLI